jgi:enoyl-CoA hydratase
MVSGVFNEIEKSEKIFIAAIRGYCLGGGLELALACDFILAGRDARFGFPEIKLGLIPGVDGIKRLTKQIGRRNSLPLLLTGDTISARQAKELGLVNAVVSNYRLMREAEALAQKISSMNPVAIRSIKKLSYDASVKDISEEEFKAAEKCHSTEYAQSKINAFLNRKR